MAAGDEGREAGGDAVLALDPAYFDLLGQPLQVVGAVAALHGAAAVQRVFPFAALHEMDGIGEEGLGAVIAVYETAAEVIEMQVGQCDGSYIGWVETGGSQRRAQGFIRVDAVDLAFASGEALADAGVEQDALGTDFQKQAVAGQADAVVRVGGSFALP